jgi:replication factor A1
MQKIGEIQPNKRNIEVQGTLKEAGDVRTFDRFGGEGRLRTYTLEDDSGSVALTLWDDDVDVYEVGDTIQIENANSKLWKNQVQISTSRKSVIKKLE